MRFAVDMKGGHAGLPEYQQNVDRMQQEVHGLGADAIPTNLANQQAVDDQSRINAERQWSRD